MSKPLIAIVSCHALHRRVNGIRETWLLDVQRLGLDYKIFVGKAECQCDLPPDTVELPLDDGYTGLAHKTQAVIRWALDNGYTNVFKCDDDTYVDATRLMKSDFSQLGHYVGRKRGPSGGFPAPYASGFSYWLNLPAMKVIASAPPPMDVAEDRWVGNTLLKAGIQCAADYRYVVMNSSRNAISYYEGPREGNCVITACEFDPDGMKRIHADRWTKPSVKSKWTRIVYSADKHPLTRVAIMVKTFLRDGYLLRTIRGIGKFLNECKVVIVDDGYEQAFKISWYSELRQAGHDCLWLPFDSGFGAKANAAVPYCDREYVLIASDDFDFTAQTRKHVTDMVNFLDLAQEYSVVAGRVNGIPYESLLKEDVPGVITETAGYSGHGEINGMEFRRCDLTVNFCLVRRSVLEKVKWDGGDCKIGGGEHGAFFMDLKKEGFRVAYLLGANINELKGSTDWEHQDYRKMRARARQPGRSCLVKRGIRQWICQDGRVEDTEL